MEDLEQNKLDEDLAVEVSLFCSSHFQSNVIMVSF